MAKEKIIRQAGAIPYYCGADGQLMTVLVTARRRDPFWLFPKGHIEPEATPVEAAAIEAYEEAGLRGQVRKKAVGSYTFTKLRRIYRVKLYPMKVKKVLKKWPEAKCRTRHLIPFEEAMARLEDPVMRRLARKLYDKLRETQDAKTTSNQILT